MKMRLAVLALTLTAAMPSIARADATAFLGRNSAATIDRSLAVLRSAPACSSSASNSSTPTPRKTTARNRPSLRTTAGNVSVQTFGLPGFQLYATTGAGYYRERLAIG